MTSSSKIFDGVTVNYMNDGGKVYRMSYTENGNFLNKSFVFGIGKNPYVRAYNRKCGIPADEMEMLQEVI